MKHSRNMTKWVAAIFLAASVASAGAKDFDLELKGRQSDGYDKSIFKLWIPDEVKTLRTIILLAVSTPGPEDKLLKDLADRNDSALLWYTTYTSEETRMKWRNSRGPRPEDEGGQINEALADLAQKSAHPEVKNAPLAILSYMHMIHPALAYLDDNPERVACLFANHARSGGGLNTKISASARKVPLCIVASDEAPAVINAELSTFIEEARKRGAPWCYATDRSPVSDGRSPIPLAIAYVEGCLKLRLPTTTATTGKPQLREADQAKGWVVERETRQAFAQVAYMKSKDKAGWLPDQKTAELWELLEAGKLEFRRDREVPRTGR